MLAIIDSRCRIHRYSLYYSFTFSVCLKFLKIKNCWRNKALVDTSYGGHYTTSLFYPSTNVYREKDGMMEVLCFAFGIPVSPSPILEKLYWTYDILEESYYFHFQLHIRPTIYTIYPYIHTLSISYIYIYIYPLFPQGMETIYKTGIDRIKLKTCLAVSAESNYISKPKLRNISRIWPSFLVAKAKKEKWWVLKLLWEASDSLLLLISPPKSASCFPLSSDCVLPSGFNDTERGLHSHQFRPAPSLQPDSTALFDARAADCGQIFVWAIRKGMSFNWQEPPVP